MRGVAVSEPSAGEPPPPEPEKAAEAPPGVADAGDLIQPVLVQPRGLVATTLGLLLATAAVAIAAAPSVQPAVQADFALQFWRPDDRQLAEIARRQDQLAAIAAALPTAPTPAAAVVADVVRWLAAEAEMGAQQVQTDAGARALRGRAEEGLRSLALAHGNDAVRGLAVQWGRQVAAAFAAAARLAQARGVTVRELVDTAQGAALRQVAPGLAPLLAHTGLERLHAGAALDRPADLVVQALAQARLLQFAVRVPDPPQLDPDLHALLLRFRVEAHEGLRLERKLALLAELTALDPTYPDALVRGVLLAREGRCDEALAGFARAMAQGQHRGRAANNLAWCRRQLRPD